MNKAIFLDKDGTLIQDVPYNVSTDRITLEEGVAEGLKALKRMGYKLVIVSNQPGVAHGYFGEQDLYEVLQHIRREARVQINGFYYCPHHPEGIIREYATDCSCRKPKAGMFFQAARELDLDLSRSWMIGDILNDVEAGNRAGCKTVLIDNGNETEWELHKERIPDFVAHHFLEAVAHIRRQEKRMHRYEDELVGL